ncbi:MAG: hypothetical protein INR62_11625, partial [Rhodospirillales bacterium]|nr:hypothetical protein [Acetobacter sp.]
MVQAVEGHRADQAAAKASFDSPLERLALCLGLGLRCLLLGEFALAPCLRGARTMQFYLPDTNVLVTRWLAEEGSAELTDLMPYPDVEAGA